MPAICANRSVQGSNGAVQIRAAETSGASFAAFQQIARPCLACIQISLRVLVGVPESELLCSFVRLLFIQIAAADPRLIKHRWREQHQSAD